MYSLSDAIYHVAKSFSHVIGGKVIEDFHLPEVGKPPIFLVNLILQFEIIGLLVHMLGKRRCNACYKQSCSICCVMN